MARATGWTWSTLRCSFSSSKVTSGCSPGRVATGFSRRAVTRRLTATGPPSCHARMAKRLMAQTPRRSMPIRTSTRAPSPSNRCEGRASCRRFFPFTATSQRRFRGRYVFFRRLPSAEGKELFLKHKAAMVRSMEATLKDPSGSGLLWSNTSGACRPQHGCMPAPLPESLAAALYQVARFILLLVG